MAMDTITGAGAASYIQQQYAGQTRIPPVTEPAGDLAASSPSAQPDDQVRLNHSVATTKNLDTARSIEQMHAQMNQLAKGIRETNEGLVQATEQSEQLRGTLQTILKNYPPFSVDSSERREILMSYVSIRKEIEQLTVPPPPTPVYEKVKHMWDSLFSGTGQIVPSAVPALTPSSSDRQLQDATRLLSGFGEKLASLSTSITEALTVR